MDSQQPPRTARNILGYYCGHLSCMPVVCRTHYKLQRDASYLVWTVNSLQGLLETFWVTIVVISVACPLCAGHITNFKGMLPIWCGQSTASKGRSCRSLVQDVSILVTSRPQLLSRARPNQSQHELPSASRMVLQGVALVSVGSGLQGKSSSTALTEVTLADNNGFRIH